MFLAKPTTAHSLEFTLFLSTHYLRSSNKKFVNYKQRALPGTDIPVPLASFYVCCIIVIGVVSEVIAKPGVLPLQITKPAVP